MRFTVLIPARLASTRLPGKPLADIAGVPMIVRVAQRAAASGAERVIVACDDEQVLKVCQEAGVQAVLTRKDHACGTDRLCEAAAASHIGDDEIIVNVQGDEPLIPPEIIRKTAAILQSDGQCMMGTGAVQIKDAQEYFNPNAVKVVVDDLGRALYFSRAPIPWDRDLLAKGEKVLPSTPALRHIGIYSYRCGFLKRYPTLAVSPLEKTESLEQLRALGNGYKIGVTVFETDIPPGVDTPEDLERVRQYYLENGLA